MVHKIVKIKFNLHVSINSITNCTFIKILGSNTESGTDLPPFNAQQNFFCIRCTKGGDYDYAGTN